MELTCESIEEFLESKGVRAILKKAKLPTKWEFDLDNDDYDNVWSLAMYDGVGSRNYFNICFSPLPGCCGGTVIHTPGFDNDSTPEQRKAFFELALKMVAYQAWTLRNAGSTVICTTVETQKHFIEVLEAHRFRQVGEHENANTHNIVTTWWKGVNGIKDADKFIEPYEDPEESSEDDKDDDGAVLVEAIGKCNCPGRRADKKLQETVKKARKPKLSLSS